MWDIIKKLLGLYGTQYNTVFSILSVYRKACFLKSGGWVSKYFYITFIHVCMINKCLVRDSDARADIL